MSGTFRGGVEENSSGDVFLGSALLDDEVSELTLADRFDSLTERFQILVDWMIGLGFDLPPEVIDPDPWSKAS